jgi:hypothetical protein
VTVTISGLRLVSALIVLIAVTMIIAACSDDSDDDAAAASSDDGTEISGDDQSSDDMVEMTSDDAIETDADDQTSDDAAEVAGDDAAEVDMDDQETDDTSMAASNDEEAYCEIAWEIFEGSGAPSEELMIAARDAAPDEIADEVAFAVDALIERGPAAFGDPDIQESFLVIDDYERRVCGIDHQDMGLPEGVTDEIDPDAVHVAVSATDFAFDFEAPPAGPVSFIMTNDGDEPHHMIIVRLFPDITLEEALEAPPDVEIGDLEVVSAVAMSGEQAVLTFENLEPGEYAMACFIPTDEGTPHAFHGMAISFTVE